MSASSETEGNRGLAPDPHQEQQLLGEIDTRIAGFRRRRKRDIEEHEVLLIRESENRRNQNAIRVESDARGFAGYLPRDLSSWLAPLVDCGALQIVGHLPTAARGWSLAASAHPLVVTVFAREQGQQWLRQAQVHDGQEALHEVVRRAYENAQTYTDPGTVERLVEGLRLLEQAELLPQTRLLLALLPGLAREVEAGLAIRTMAAFRSQLTQVVIGSPVICRCLTFFPLSWPAPLEPPYVLLSDAIESGEALVEEVTEDGSVPNLRVSNRCKLPLLIPEGEILVGAKQNRVVNATVLVAAYSTFALPVSCVEQGRWGYQSREMRSAFCAPPSLRSRKMRTVQEHREAGGPAESDQGAVWEQVAQTLDSLRVHSPTASLADSLASNEERLRAWRAEVQLPEDTAGVLVAWGPRVVGLDLFDSPRTFAKLRQRLTDAYLLDALWDEVSSPSAHPRVAAEFVDRVVSRARLRVPSLGLGDELELVGPGDVGAALLYAGRVVHLAAFAEGA